MNVSASAGFGVSCFGRLSCGFGRYVGFGLGVLGHEAVGLTALGCGLGVMV